MPRSAETDTLAAVQVLLLPLARLMLAHGLKLAQANELLKAAFVSAAVEQRGAVSSDRAISALSVTTGLHRKEVKRLVASPPRAQHRGRSYAAEVFTRWATDPAYRGPDGRPLALPRSGEAPSFDALTRSISTDVHARSILEELKRLNLAVEDGASVRLTADEYWAGADKAEALALLAANVGDHLNAAVTNVTSRGMPPFLEQAIYADELSAASAQQASKLATQAWRALLSSVTPKLQAMADQDAAGADRNWRVRIGLFTFSEGRSEASTASASPKPSTRAKRPRVAVPAQPTRPKTSTRGKL
jgi:hypothetical protein